MFRKLLFTMLVIATTLQASSKSQNSVTEIYIATFDRAPVSDGLNYWINISDLALEGVAMSFFDQDETKEKYPNAMGEEEFINEVYDNLFRRAPDKAGFDYWLNELENNPDIHRSVFLLAVINGATGSDEDILTNKTTVGLSFAHDGRYDLKEAVEVLVGVTADESSVDEVLTKYDIPKYSGGIGNGTLPPPPAEIAGLLESTRVARERLESYTPSGNYSYGKEFFVSPTGSDTNVGTIDAPLASLKGARDAVRAYKSANGLPSGGIVVWFRGGNYSSLEYLDFKAEDSGESSRPIAYRGYEDEKVRIMGAVPINSSWFTPVSSSDPLYGRLDSSARDNIMVVNLKDHGITDLGELGEYHYASNTPLELFDDTEPLTLARWPNEDETTKIPYFTDNTATIYGANLSPDVSGTYTKETGIGADEAFYSYASFKKDTLVDGKQFYIRHYKAQSDGVRRTWAITDSDYRNASFEYSGTGYSIPRDFTSHSSSASGIPMTVEFEDIQFGFAFMRRGLSNKKFEYVGDRPSRWKNTGDLWVNGMFYYAWRNEHNTLESIDTANRTITMKYNDDLGIKQREIKRPYFVYNVIEELNSAGEYYIDRGTSNLYYYPKRDLTSSRLYASLTEDYLINFDGASFVEFHDMALEMSRQDIVQFSSGSHNLLSHLRIRLSGRHLVNFEEEKPSYSGVEYSILSGSGERAVRLNGGDRYTLTNGYNFVTNNHIIGDNRWTWAAHAAGIGIYGVGNIVEHNDIHGYKYQAIYFNGNNCSISYNNIYDVLKYTEDAGVIYGGRNWHHRGNKINYNFIHDVKNNYSQQILTGIYFDSTLSGEEIRGNIFYNIDGKGMLQAGGRDNIIENNLFVHIATPFMGMNYGIIAYSTEPGDSFNMLERALEYDYPNGVYASSYPKLSVLPPDWDALIGTHWLLPEGNSFRYNAGEDNLRWALDGKIKSGTLDLEVYDHAEMTPTPQDSVNFKPLPYDKIGIEM